MTPSWYRVKTVFKGMDPSVVLHSTLQAIMKHSYCEAFPETEWKNRGVPDIFYHLPEKKYDYFINKDETFDVHFFFCRMERKKVLKFLRALRKRMSEGENQKYYSLVNVNTPELRTLKSLEKEVVKIPDNGKITLNFFTPLPFKPKKEESTSFFNNEMLIKALENRMIRFFGNDAPVFKGNPEGFSVDSSQWKYTKLCTHQKDGIYGQRIQGCTGRLYVEGKLEGVRELIMYATELHAGSELTSSQGYFNIESVTGDSDIKEKVPEHCYKKPLYILSSHNNISIKGDTVETTSSDKKNIETYPINRISEIIVFDKAVFSTDFIKKCSLNNIPVAVSLGSADSSMVFIPQGRSFYDTISAHRERYKSLAETDKLNIAGEFAISKIVGTQSLLKERYIRGTALVIKKMDECVNGIRNSKTTDEIRGYEGFASKIFHENLKKMIKEESFLFKNRSRKEPDRMNALLNYGYAVLFIRINLILTSLGLDPFLGFLHNSNNRYESLVCDLQELFRARTVRAVVRMVNLKIIKEEDFVENIEKVIMKYNAKKAFLDNFERELQRIDPLTGKTLKEEIYDQCLNIKNWAQNGTPLSFYKWSL